MISFDPTDEEQAIRDEVHRFAEKELRPRGRDCEKARSVPDDLRASYAALGIPSLDWPEEAGGLGLSITARMLVEEELAWGDAGLACALDTTGFAAAVIEEMAPALRQGELLRSLATPGQVTALAFAEADEAAMGGASVATSAVPDGSGGLLLEGAKLFVAHAPQATRLLVLARSQGRPALFLLERNGPGITIGREDERVGLQALRSAEVRLAAAHVASDVEVRLVPEGPFAPALDRALARIWLTIAARQVGIARAALEYATFYAQDRSAFGKKIGQFQGIAFKVADVAIAVDAARWLVWRAATLLAKRAEGAPREAALALLQANETAVKAAIDCVQVLGGAGFMEDYPAEKWMREARALASLAGSDGLRAHMAAERLYGPGLEAEAASPLASEGSSDEAMAVMEALGRAFGVGGS